MKRNLAIILSTLFILALFQMSSFRLVSNSSQPPYPSISGNSLGLAGDPGQSTCNHCHTGTTRIDASKFTLRISPDSAGLATAGSIVTPATQYIPDSTQWVSIELNGTNGATPKYGFQLTALDSTDMQAGTFTLTNTARTSAQASSNGRKYVGHRAANGTTHAWSFKWRSPHSGPITFYYAGNIANGDGTETTPGDSVYAGSATVTAGPVINGISDLGSDISAVSAYPVPFSHSLQTDFVMEQPAALSISLMSLEGAMVRQLYSGDVSQGHFSRSFDLSAVASGVYMVRIASGSSARVIRVVKL